MTIKETVNQLTLSTRLDGEIADGSVAVNTGEALANDLYLIERDGRHYAGRHYIIDFWGMENLNNVDYIERAVKGAAVAAKATLLHMHLHEFSGGGVTGVALLAESHISVHTWPEHDYAAFDVFMCGQSEVEKAVDLLCEAFSPDKQSINELLRGRVEPQINY